MTKVLWSFTTPGVKKTELKLLEYTDTTDMFICTAKWHMKNPDFLKTWATYNGTHKAWLVQRKSRSKFIDCLNKKLGVDELEELDDAPKPKPKSKKQELIKTHVDSDTDQEIYNADTESDTDKSQTRAPARAPTEILPVVRVQANETVIETLEYCLKRLGNSYVSRSAEYQSARRCYISNTDAATVSSRAMELKTEGWHIIAWFELEASAHAILEK